MEPVTVIVSALAAGAAAGLKPLAEQTIEDAYAGLKGLILRQYGSASLEALEQKPESPSKRESVAEDLTDAGAGNDRQLLEQAKALLDLVKAHEPQTAAAIGVDLEKIEAEYLKLKDIVATGPSGATGLKVREGKFTGGIDIEGVSADIRGEPTPKKS